jgi:beta-N-acetylhexosaminidase
LASTRHESAFAICLGMADKQRTRFVRRRYLALAAVCGLAAGAFALGAALGDGPAVRPSVASQLTRAQLAGQRIVLGFPGTNPPAAVARLIREGGVAGVILFSDNLPTRAAGRQLIRRLQSIRRPPRLRDPLLVMVDQEGGLVKRIDGAPTASAQVLGSRGASFSRMQGRRTAANLRDLGANVDLAPVLDVARPGGTIALTDRGFGSTAAAVAATAVPFAEGLQAGGVAATAKHFPGLGAALLNTDDAVQRIGLSASTLRQLDEAPYKGFIAAGGEMVMLSTAIYPAFSDRPAAFSSAIASDELRSRLGFKGVSITDALDTVAVRAFGNPAKVARAAATAGADLLLYTEPAEATQAHRSLVRALRSGKLLRADFEDSIGRVLQLRHELGASG